MSDTKISALTDGTSAQSGDLIPIARSGANYTITPGYIGTTLLGSTSLTGATVTTSQPVLNLSQTWNASGVTFTGLKFNATDTASASGSLLLDIGTGGGTYTSQFSVTKAGNGYFNNSLSSASSQVSGTGTYELFGNSTLLKASSRWPGGSGVGGRVFLAVFTGSGTNHIAIPSDAQFSWSQSSLSTLTTGSGSDVNSTRDLFLTRAAAASLQLGAADAAAPVAQTLQVQSVVAGTTNTAGTNFTIAGSKGTGTGAGGSIIFQVAPAGSSGTSQNALATALTIASDKSVTFNATAGAKIDSNGVGNFVGVYANAGSGVGSNYVRLCGTTLGVELSSSSSLIWYPNAPISGSADLALTRDAANTLALRNGTNAQTFNVYNTYTDASNYERLRIFGGATYFGIYCDKAGTGASRTLVIQGNSDININSGTSGGITFAPNSATAWNMNSSGHFLAWTDNTYDIGASGANRPRNVYVANDGTFGATITGVNIRGTTLRTSGYLEFLSYAQIKTQASAGVLTLLNWAETGFDRLQFGGTSSSFPALKCIASGNCLQVIAADNTASAGFIVGNQALATTATDGFLYIPTCAGTPTGTPTTQTGTAPLVVDTTNNKLYVYVGGAWTAMN